MEVEMLYDETKRCETGKTSVTPNCLPKRNVANDHLLKSCFRGHLLPKLIVKTHTVMEEKIIIP
jgi:hypothetical protein